MTQNLIFLIVAHVYVEWQKIMGVRGRIKRRIRNAMTQNLIMSHESLVNTCTLLLYTLTAYSRIFNINMIFPFAEVNPSPFNFPFLRKMMKNYFAFLCVASSTAIPSTIVRHCSCNVCIKVYCSSQRSSVHLRASTWSNIAMTRSSQGGRDGYRSLAFVCVVTSQPGRQVDWEVVQVEDSPREVSWKKGLGGRDGYKSLAFVYVVTFVTSQLWR